MTTQRALREQLDDLLDACVAYEQATAAQTRRARDNYHAQKQAFLARIEAFERVPNESEMLAALTKLSNEVLGTLPLMEPLARREFGNSNYNILIQRAEEARTIVATAQSTEQR